jgi:2-dehydro-3-deoxy-D-arabinonate dehydratase
LTGRRFVDDLSSGRRGGGVEPNFKYPETGPIVMQIVKYVIGSERTPEVGMLKDNHIRRLASGVRSLSEWLHDENLLDRLGGLPGPSEPDTPLESVRLLAPIDAHEVWGAGVTYERSKVARQEESEQGGSFYDLVYRAPRPELFLKATPSRVVGPGAPIRVRRDTQWCVPEPELALVLSPTLRLVGFTVGNDVSARDIEGENPLYLPQAKVYDASCALGPVITLAPAMPPLGTLTIRLEISRAGTTAFAGTTSVGRMARGLDELIDWLGRDNVFPDGVVLLTGTGIVPPDDFTLQAGDMVQIAIDGIGTLVNPVVQGPRTG